MTIQRDKEIEEYKKEIYKLRKTIIMQEVEYNQLLKEHQILEKKAEQRKSDSQQFKIIRFGTV